MATLAAGRLQAGTARTASPPPPAAPVNSLDALPRDVLLRIVSLLTFEEAAAIRPTSRNIARAAEEMLARAFDGFGAMLLRRIRELRLAPDFSFYTCLVCKTLYQIEIEYRLLRAAVGVYVREGSAPFVGGRLLDLLWEALRLSSSPPSARDDKASTPSTPTRTRTHIVFADLFTPDIVDELSTLVEQYIAFYEKEVEPRLRAPTPLAVKVVDVLDAFVGASSDAEIRTHGGWRSLRARYYLPLTGLMFHDEDPEPTARLVVAEGEARSLLAALREAARKSGQRYVSVLLQRELASAEARRNVAQSGLFSSRRRCVARDRMQTSPSSCSGTSAGFGGVVCAGAAGGAGSVLRERLERRPLREPPPPERDRHSLVLRVAVRLRFLLNQRPLEAECMGVPLDESAGGAPNDPGGWGWATGDEEEAPPPDGGPPPHEDPRAAFWFQLEVHRLPPGRPALLQGPVPPLGPPQGQRRRLSFQPARYRRLRPAAGVGTGLGGDASPLGVSQLGAASDDRVLSVSLRDVCVSYAPPLPPQPPQEAFVAVTYGRLRRAPSTASVGDVQPKSGSPSPTPLSPRTPPPPPSSQLHPRPSPREATRALEEALGALRDARAGEGSALEQLRMVLTAAAAAATSPRGRRGGAGEEEARNEEAERRSIPGLQGGGGWRSPRSQGGVQRVGAGEDAWKEMRTAPLPSPPPPSTPPAPPADEWGHN